MWQSSLFRINLWHKLVIHTCWRQHGQTTWLEYWRWSLHLQTVKAQSLDTWGLAVLWLSLLCPTGRRLIPVLDDPLAKGCLFVAILWTCYNIPWDTGQLAQTQIWNWMHLIPFSNLPVITFFINSLSHMFANTQTHEHTHTHTHTQL